MFNASKKWTIKKQLIVLSVGVSFFALSILGIIASMQGAKSLLETKIEGLTSIMNAKKEHIENFYSNLGVLLANLSYSNLIQDAVVEFDKSFSTLESDISLNSINIHDRLTRHYESEYISKIHYDIPNVGNKKSTIEYLPQSINGKIAQYLYIVENQNNVGEKNKLINQRSYTAAYTQVHAKYHDYLNHTLEKFDLYDIFLINTNGDIVYSTFKEKDFATNLNNGPYNSSSLAKVFNKALLMINGEIAFEDMKPYEPSYNLPASFIATPIFKNNQKVGVIAFQLPIDELNRIMSFGGKYQDVGLGDSGECYLVGNDYKMRNNSRFIKDIDDKVVKNLNTTMGVFSVKTASVSNALNGTVGNHIIKDYRGVDVVSTYNYIDIFGARWGIVAEIDKSEVLIPINNLIFNTILISIVIVMIVMVVSILLANKIAKPIANTVLVLQNISENLVNSATMITDSSVSMSESANHQAATVEQITATIEQSTANTHQNSEHSNTAKKLSEQVKIYANNGYAEIKILEQSMINITNSSDEIYKITKTIDEIAFQTNLLSLNAAVEAARAGEHGLSFAVVADEVRSLANKSANAAKETANIIQNSIKDINSGNKINDRVNVAFNDILNKVNQTDALIGEISLSSQELSTGMTQVSRVLIDIDKVTQLLAGSSEELASSAEELKEQVKFMDKSVQEIAQLI